MGSSEEPPHDETKEESVNYLGLQPQVRRFRVLKSATGRKNHVSVLTLPPSISVKTTLGSTPVKSKKPSFVDLSVQKSEI